MLLCEQGSHSAEAEHEVIAGDAEEHQGAHGFAAGHEAAEHQKKGRFDRPHARHIGQSVGEEQHQAGQQLDLPEVQPAGEVHEPDAEIRQGEHQKQLERVQRKNFDAAGLVGDEMAALRAEGVQLLEPFFPAGLPLFGLGQIAQRLAGQPLDERRNADENQRHDDRRDHQIG